MKNQHMVKSAQTIRALLERPDVRQQLGMAIPKHLTVDRLLRVAMTSIQRNPTLMECTPRSLLGCIMTCAQLGLEPDGFTGQAYLVPFRNKGVLEAQLIPGYRGLLALARRSGEILSVQAQVVYERDRFELQYGLNEKLEHVPADGDRGNPKGAYVIFRYKDGSHSFDYMSAADIERIRARSKSPDSGPWATDWDEMAKKTVIRRHAKLAPMSIEFQRAVALEDRFHAGETQMDLLGIEEPDEDAIDLAAEAAWEKMMESRTVPADGSFERFVEITAERNGISAAEVKAAASKDTATFDKFWSMFETWRKKNSPNVDPSVCSDESNT